MRRVISNHDVTRPLCAEAVCLNSKTVWSKYKAQGTPNATSQIDMCAPERRLRALYRHPPRNWRIFWGHGLQKLFASSNDES